MACELSMRLLIDWSMLEEQKAFLMALIEADCESPNGLTRFGHYGSWDDHPLEGIVQLIGAIQDTGTAMGEKVYSDDEAGTTA